MIPTGTPTVSAEMEAKPSATKKRRRRKRKTQKRVIQVAYEKAEAHVNGADKPRVKRARRVRVKANARRKASKRSVRKPGRKPYPVVPFSDAITLAEGIMKHNGGQPTKRETLLHKMGLATNATSTRNLITNSGKYGLTEGGYTAPTLKLTSEGALAVDTKGKRLDQLKARFALAIGHVSEFNTLYEKRKGNNMPAPEMLHDDLHDLDEGDRKPCADIFISNVKYLGLLTERDGAQYLQTVDEWLTQSHSHIPSDSPEVPATASTADVVPVNFSHVCFVISTINEAGSDERKHADMVLRQYVERALDGTGLKVVRADKIGDPGMISKQVIEHIVHAKLVIADLSFHNPNVFYELALRHVTGKPTVHLIQECDKIPFDLGNFRTIKVDTGDKYKMVAELDTLRSEIAAAIKQALANGESRDNPILTFCPKAKFVLNADG